MPVTTRRATLDDLGDLVPLFSDYRSFYAQRQDPDTARRFLYERLSRNESTILLAHLDGLRGGAPVGFAQLYPMFSSVRAARVFVLNDLFVAEHARRKGVALALLSAAAEYGQTEGAIRLDLETMPDNHGAQTLYRANGWRQHDESLRFQLPLAPVWSDE
jgi:ribosomal protein S18 acetylase RimI-like enzyme